MKQKKVAGKYYYMIKVRSPGEENGNPLQYPCLENPMDRGAWWTAVHGVTKSDMTEATENPHTVPDEVPRVSMGWGLIPLQAASPGQ